jgi:anthranilate phosphoribosyltransferase
VDDGEARLQVISPDAYGLEAAVPDMEWTAQEQLRVMESVLRGEGNLAFIHQTLLNGAVWMHLAEKVSSIEEGLYTCRTILDAGEAEQAYLKWKSALEASSRFSSVTE